MENYFSCVGKRTRAQTDQYLETLYRQSKGNSEDSYIPHESKRQKSTVRETTPVVSSRKQTRKKKTRGGPVSKSKLPDFEVSSRKQGRKEKTRGEPVSKSKDPDFEFLGIEGNGAGPSRVNSSSEFKFVFEDNDDDVEVIEMGEEIDRNVCIEVDGDDDDVEVIEVGEEIDRNVCNAVDDDDDADDHNLNNSGFGNSGLKTRVQLEPEFDDESDGFLRFDFEVRKPEHEGLFEVRNAEKVLKINSESSHGVSFSGLGNLSSSSDTDDDDDDDSQDEDFQVGVAESSESLDKASSYEEEEVDEEDSLHRTESEKDEMVCREGKESGIRSKNIEVKLEPESSNEGSPEKESSKIQKKLGTAVSSGGNRGRGSFETPKKLDKKPPNIDLDKSANDIGSGIVGESTSAKMNNQIQRDESSKKGKRLNVPSCDDDADENGVKDSDKNGTKDEPTDEYSRGFAAGLAFAKRVAMEEEKSGKLDATKGSCKTQKKFGKKSMEGDHNNGDDNGSVVGDTDTGYAENGETVFNGEIKRTRSKRTCTEVRNQRDTSSKTPNKLNVVSGDGGGGGDDDNDASGVKISDDNGAKGDGNGEINNDFADGVTFGEEKVSQKERKSEEVDATKRTTELNHGNGEFNNDFADGVTFGKEKVSVKENNGGEFDATKRTRELKSSDACELLLNAIFARGEGIEKNFVTFEQKAREEETPPAAEQTLPLKFFFGVEEPKPVKKSDNDMEMDSIWDELQVALHFEDIGSFSPPVVEPEQADAFGTDDLCSQGKHQFILDEEIGIKCLGCLFVKVEIKYNLPPVLEKISSGISRKKFPSDEEDINIPDELQFQNAGVKSGGACSHTEGTVWDIIPGIKKTMYQHQQEGFEFIWKNMEGTLNLDEFKISDSNGVGGCIISHAPGTGKTRLTILFLQTYLELFPDTLPVIIAPASMLLTWEEEFKKWGISIPFHNVNNLDPTDNENVADVNIADMNGKGGRSTDLLRLVKFYLWSKGKSILGISYSLYEKLVGEKTKLEREKKKGMKITKETEELRRILLEFPGLLVLDEGHTPRNQRSQIWKALTKVETKRRIILSGTPFQNNFRELYNILCLVRPEFADLIPSNLKKFCQNKSRRRKVLGMKSAFTDKLEDEAIEELKGMIAPFVHVHKGSILKESLPGLKDCVVVLHPANDTQKRIVSSLQSSVNTFEFEHKLALCTVHPSLILKVILSKKEESVLDKALLQQLRLNPNEGSKTRFLMELVRLSVALNEKVLVFSQFIDPLHLIRDQLCSIFSWSEGKELLLMQGKLDQEHRQSMINIFNDPKSKAMILLASTKACSEGINLVGASRVVLLDVVWNPSVERQAISRAYRLGQMKVVYTYHLLLLGTSEWEKYCKQAEKDRLSELVFSSSDKENEKQKTSLELSEDKILDDMISHDKLKGMFERIIYQPKESNLIETFT